MYSLPVHAPTTAWPMTRDNSFRRSWGEGDEHVNEEHTRIFDEMESLPGWHERGDSEKLYEMAFRSGAVILEIGTHAGRSAALAIRAALAGLAVSATGRLPQFYGVDPDPQAIAQTHKTLNALGLAPYALLFVGKSGTFHRRLPIVPTMVFLNGSHDYKDVWSDLHNLSEILAPGTPVLCHDYARHPEVTRAVNGWAESGYFEPMGRFGSSALLRATKRCGGVATGLPLEVFEAVRESLLKEYLNADGTAKWNPDAPAIGRAMEPARVALLTGSKISSDYSKRGWPYEKVEGTWFPDALPDGTPWPKISIVTPSYNYGRFLEETILSIHNQGYPNVEHIVMDGGSTDNTVEVMEKYRDKFAYAVSEPDKGQSDAINKGFARATGDLFTWINADDFLAPGALHGMALAFWHSKADVVAGICEQYRDGRLIEKHMTCCDNGPLPLKELLDLEGSWVQGQFFMQPEVMFTRAIWEKAGGRVEEGLFYSMDYEMWLRFALAGARLHVIGRSICHFRHHSEQKTASPDKFMPELLHVRDAFAAKHQIVPAEKHLRPSPQYSLRIASVNDNGFRYGAGIGQKRIMNALAAAGHDVYSFAAIDESTTLEVSRIDEVLQAVETVSPHIVLIGNIHGAKLPAESMSLFASRWPTGVILHDLWALTGRCAYNAGCKKYLTGCDETCPTPHEYPARPPEAIRSDWEIKYAAHDAASPPVLLANSQWMADVAKESLRGRQSESTHRPASSRVFPIRFGLELENFRPLPKAMCRRELGLPLDRFLILASASSLDDPRKGIALIVEAVRNLSLPDVTIVCLGRADDAMKAAFPGIVPLGYVNDPRRLAMVYSAVDLFVGASLEEAFGQVFTEAAACGTPSVGFPVGGVPEAIRDGVTGYVTAAVSANELACSIYDLYSNPHLRRSMGVWGRIFAENEWSPEMAYHQLHVAFRLSGISERINFPPKVRFVPHPLKLPPATTLPPLHGEWHPLSGFAPWEGPYPDQGLPRCRWLGGAVSSFRVVVGHPGLYRLRISCSTFHHNAVLRVVHQGKLVHDAAVPPFVKGQAPCAFTCDLELDEKSGTVELHHWPWQVDDPIRGMSILLFELTVTSPSGEELKAR